MVEVVSLGEAVIDMFAAPVGVDLPGAEHFVAAPGGAPANVAVALARLGVETGFIGRVGADSFGHMLVGLLGAEGIDTRCFLPLAEHPTMLALVAASGPEEQDFVLYHGAEEQLAPEDIDGEYLAGAKVLVYGSITLSGAAAPAALRAAKLMADQGGLVAYDANLRPALWPDLPSARRGILRGLATASVVKLNKAELELLSGSQDPLEGCRWVLAQGPALCVVTLGAAGAYFANGRARGAVPGFAVEALDTTGCGDGFLAGLIAGLLAEERDPAAIGPEGLTRIVRFANAVGALSAQAQGAMAGLPRRAAVEKLVADGVP